MMDFDDLEEAEEEQAQKEAEEATRKAEEARKEEARRAEEARKAEEARLATESLAAEQAAQARAEATKAEVSRAEPGHNVAELVDGASGGVWLPWQPMPEDKWAKYPRAGVGEKPTNMAVFKKVVNERALGEFWGLVFPFSPAQLREMGPAWLTTSMHTAGTLPKDNEVVKFTRFDVKAEDVTTVGNPDDNNWGGAGLKILLSVEYKREPTAVEPGRDMFVKMPHEFTGKNERYRNSVTASGDWPESMFYNLLGGRLPFRTPRGYFCDMNRRTTNFIIVTERIPYGDKWERSFAPYEILPAPGKYRDWSLPCAAELYYAHARTMAHFFGWHHETRKSTDQVDKCFMDEGGLAFRQHLFSQVEPLSSAERDKFFVKSLTDPMLGPAVASMGFNPQTTEGFLSMAESFVREVAPHTFPKELATKSYLDKFFREAKEMSKYCAEMTFYSMMVPEYFTLAHPNAQIDNAFYWRDDKGLAHCGLLDWGGCSHSAMPVCLANGWIGAEPETLDEHEQKLTQCFLDEYEKITGVKLDFEDFYMNVKLAHASVLYGCCANVRWCVQLIKKEDWKGVKDRFDKRIDDGFLLRCYFVQIQMFLGMWKNRSPYSYWQKWMKRTGMPAK